VQQTVATRMTTRYVGFNDCHLTEKLREQHGLPISRESVCRLRQALGRPAQPPPRARRRRVPEAARGALVQIDGSPCAWLERRPRSHVARRHRRWPGASEQDWRGGEPVALVQRRARHGRVIGEALGPG
jgi:hypothetical protein